MGYQTKTPSLRDLHTGYVIEMSSGKSYLIGRIKNFEKVLVDPIGGRPCGGVILGDIFNDSLVGKGPWSEMSIDKVYGLPNAVNGLFNTNTSIRPLIWARRKVKKMTVAEISQRLGYEVEIVEG